MKNVLEAGPSDKVIVIEDDNAIKLSIPTGKMYPKEIYEMINQNFYVKYLMKDRNVFEIKHLCWNL